MTAIDGTTFGGVSTTTLWTLHNRASEARRPDGAVTDPWAVTLFDAIDHDYAKFGKPDQSHGLRAATFDGVTADHLLEHPRTSIVALAEGLQTSFWRLDAAGLLDEATWFSVDLPPVMEVRRQLLPDDTRIVALAQSALDWSWMDAVADRDGQRVFITAEGLLMYLDPDDVFALITACAARFPGGAIMFDSIPHWFSRKTMKGFKLSERYVAPPMPFALTADEALALPDRLPGVRSARDVHVRPGRGAFKVAGWPVLDRIGPIRRARPSITVLEFE
ncbi:MAG: class I SAM-dependent methyltransferase [Mycobacterium sp.]